MTVTSSVSDAGSDGFDTAQVSVDTSVRLIAAARPGRNSITVFNEGTTLVRVGKLGVTLTTGMPLVGVAGASITIPTQAAVYGIVGAGTQLVSILETF